MNSRLRLKKVISIANNYELNDIDQLNALTELLALIRIQSNTNLEMTRPVKLNHQSPSQI
jgi:hypothetical protein